MTNEEKTLIDAESSIKSLSISFPNLDIAPIEIDRTYEQEMSLTESLCEDDNLVLGKCNSSQFKIKVADFNDDVKNEEIVVNIHIHKDNLSLTDLDMKLGKFIIKNIERTADRRYKILTAYDFMSKFDKDVTEWFNSVLFPENDTVRTVNEILEMLCAHVGILYDKEYELINGEFVIAKTIEPTYILGRTILECLLEINAVFGHMNPDGILNFISIGNAEEVELYPQQTLYPSDSLYPGTQSSGEKISLYQDISYQDYKVKSIDSLQIRMESDDIGITVGDGNNTYVISGNFLTYSASQQELEILAGKMIGKISNISYYPATMTKKGGTYLNLGDAYSFVTRYGEEITSFVQKREICGIGSITTTISSTGDEYREAATVSLKEEISILKGKSSILKKDLESLSMEFKDYDKNVSSKIKQNAETIELVVEGVDGEGHVILTQKALDFMAENITLKGKHIQLDGDTEIGANFILKSGKIQNNTYEDDHAFEIDLASSIMTLIGGSTYIADNGEQYEGATEYSGGRIVISVADKNGNILDKSSPYGFVELSADGIALFMNSLASWLTISNLNRRIESSGEMIIKNITAENNITTKELYCDKGNLTLDYLKTDEFEYNFPSYLRNDFEKVWIPAGGEKTLLGSFTLEKGNYIITFSAIFDEISNADAELMLWITLTTTSSMSKHNGIKGKSLRLTPAVIGRTMIVSVSQDTTYYMMANQSGYSGAVGVEGGYSCIKL